VSSVPLVRVLTVVKVGVSLTALVTTLTCTAVAESRRPSLAFTVKALSVPLAS